MVFFSCDKCAETLKKSKVDLHARRCGCDSVSCVDCGVSFWGDDYKQHTSCISEAERYEKTVYKGPRKNDTKGRKLTPQENWMEIIHESSLSNCPSGVASYLQNLSSYDNVPRKERAFRNFASNSLKLRGSNGEAIITSIWNHLSSVRQERLKAQENAKKEKKAETDTKNEVKVPLESSTDKPKIDKVSGSMGKDSGKKKIAIKAMKRALKKAPSKQLKMKELRKIVKNKLESSDESLNKDELKGFIKDIISENKSISSEGKVVKLMQ